MNRSFSNTSLFVFITVQILIATQPQTISEARLLRKRTLKKDKQAWQAHGCTLDGNGDPCEDGYFCQLDEGQECEGTGECVRVTHRCRKIWRPVCGCNGQIYSNACLAAAKSINVAGHELC